jgi:hypothetical protein
MDPTGIVCEHGTRMNLSHDSDKLRVLVLAVLNARSSFLEI